jgi:hypothetical protein
VADGRLWLLPDGIECFAGDLPEEEQKLVWVHPDLERSVAERMGAKTTEIDSSHVPMLSHPDVVLDVIRAAASSAQESLTA